MKVVITGAAGLVGLNLSGDIKHYTIVAIDANEKRLELIRKQHPTVTVVRANLAKRGDWEAHFKGADAVIQLQAQISAPTRQPYVANNITSVRHVLKACKKHRVGHLIHLSSSVVISVSNDLYVQTKRNGEKQVLRNTVPYTIIRPPLMYGCYDYKHLGYLTAFIEKTLVVPMPGTGKFIRQPLYVKDLCAVISNCLNNKPRNAVFNIIGRELITFRDMLQILIQERKLRRILVPVPLWLIALGIRFYRFINPKSPYVIDQLYALTAGDVFPVSDWEKIFSVKYTPLKKAIRQMVHDPNYEYRSGHVGS